MATDAIAVVEASALKRDRGAFAPGDSVRVHVKVIEGEKERVQIFEGMIIRKRGEGARATFTVRRVSLRRRRRADLPAPLPAGRACPGREVRARPPLQALLPPGAHREGCPAAGEAARAARGAEQRGARRGRRVAARRAPRRRPAARPVVAWAWPRVRQRRSGPLQTGLFELEEDLYAQERGAWARGLWVAGVDEVGRGPLAGPVVAAAVILDPTTPIDGLRDSKLLTGAAAPTARAGDPRPRARLRGRAGRAARDRRRSTCCRRRGRAMRAGACAAPSARPASCSSTATSASPASTCTQRAIVAGDRRSASVAAASILAKVVRDAFMARADRRYPGYGFRQHKGYATAAHLEALARLGPCPLHRRSFHGVAPGGMGEPVDASPRAAALLT